MPVDTNALIRLFDFTGVTHYSNSELLLNYKESEELQYVIWNKYFKLDKRIFRGQGDYVFAHSITTDGIGLSIRFIHKDHVERFQRRYQKKNKNQKKLQTTTKKQRKCQQKQEDLKLCPLVTDLSNTKKSEFRKRSLVGLDPGLGNLVYLIGDNDQRLRYTSQQRYKESYSRQNRTVRQRIQKKAGTQQIEQVLNEYNSKTMDYDKFKKFLCAKFRVMVGVRDHYRQLVYRKLNLRRFIYGKRSEAKLLNAIESKFGADCVIGYGNWSRRSAMPGTAPVPGISLKRKIAARFTTASIDEYKTSSVCHSCQVGSLENVYHKKNGRNQKIHRLLMCRGCCSLQNGNKVRYINRDVVGSKNILSVLECELSNKERPMALKRNGINSVAKIDPFSAVSVCLPKQKTIIKKRISLSGG